MSGKDLTKVPVIIGIGGPVINSEDPAKILSNAVYDPSKYEFLKPASPRFFLDGKYVFASMGLVAKVDQHLALEIMKEEIAEIQGGRKWTVI